jgi:putative RNA 2'-phosphotransferase
MIKLKDIMEGKDYSNKLIKVSKYLSYVLRHNPQSIGLSLDPNGGWADVKELIRLSNITMDTLLTVVKTNNKKRFEFNADRSKIRASQGHSVDVDLGYSPSIPPPKLYHGTAKQNLDSIRTTGINKGTRQHVHLSSDVNTAMKVGSRWGDPVTLEIDAVKMAADGHTFFISTNGVWLTDHVPTEYIT